LSREEGMGIKIDGVNKSSVSQLFSVTVITGNGVAHVKGIFHV
jgi:hypothetical protein